MTFNQCHFEHLGGIYALSALGGSQHVTIANSSFTDVSGGGIHIGSSGSRWTTGPKADVAISRQTSQSGVEARLRSQLTAQKCVDGKLSQLWYLTKGVTPGAGPAITTVTQGNNNTDGEHCWKVIACSSDEGTPIGVGFGCTPLPSTTVAHRCGPENPPGANCPCNGAFVFHGNGTITSVMDGHCLEVARTAGSEVTTGKCTGSADQHFLVAAAGPGVGYTVSLDEGMLCLDAVPSGPSPGPPGPPAPHPPGPAPLPPVPEEEWDRWYTIMDNLIYDMPVEYRSAMGVRAKLNSIDCMSGILSVLSSHKDNPWSKIVQQWTGGCNGQ